MEHLDIPEPRGRRNRAEITEPAGQALDWPTPSTVPEPKRDRYELNRLAVRLYVSGQTEAEVNAELRKRWGHGLPAGSVWRLAQRCTAVNPETGELTGFWACIPHWRAAPGPRGRHARPKTHRNKRHHLSVLFDEFPDIEARLCNFVLKRTVARQEMRPVAKLTVQKVWDVFLSECKLKMLHLQDNRWPFNDDRRGYEAVRRWYRDEKYRNPSQAAVNELDADTAKMVARDYRGIAVQPLAVSRAVAYARTELDEHKMDHMWSILLPSANEGEWIASHETRLWALVMAEKESQAVLSTGVAFGRSYSRADLLRLIHGAIQPPERPSVLRLDDSEWQFASGARYPGEDREFSRNTWQVLSMDSHSVHRSTDAVHAIEQVTHCQVDFDAVGDPTRRALIEGFFARIAKVSEWYESATGSKPDSGARRDPEGGAVRSRVYMPLAEEYLDVLCRNHNVTPLKCLDGSTPMERLYERLKQDRCFTSKVGAFGKNNLHLLLPRFEANLRRRHSKTHGPICVYFGYTYYVGPALSSCQELMFSQDLTVDVYVQEDARFAFVVPRAFPERTFKVVVAGRWRNEPHPLSMRTLTGNRAFKKWFEGHTSMPLTGVGLARGLAKAASTNEGLARLVGGYTAFADRYGSGVVPNINLSNDDIARLLDFANGLGEDDAWSEVQAEEGGSVTSTGGASSSSERSSDTNPFGII